eukprot:TRINITY_DN577_c0_g1_i1.p1 TRINITY_DN577_c0_g1~~TRINITY_DN577_c0_g1_i1.p1  ORF type:complete len:474 (+),score=242.10 TRINITY_DN577_c0_g1_i1:39-1460(+)
MIQSIFILNNNGEVLIEKHYRGRASRVVCDQFWEIISKAENKNDVEPILPTEKFYLTHIKTPNLYFVAPVAGETSPIFVLEFLRRVVDNFQRYFQSVTEESLKENFVIVYQLLEEMNDNGFPFITEPSMLQDLIATSDLFQSIRDWYDSSSSSPSSTNSSSIASVSSIGNSISSNSLGIGNNNNNSNNNNNNNNNSSSKFFSNNSSISSISSSNNNNNSNLSTITWRRQGVKHAVNELFVDLIEEIDCIIEAGGLTVASSIHGRLEVQSHLSGMPDLTLFFNRTNLIEASSLHPCVRLARYQQDQTVSFIPPDGNFTLLTYMAHQPIQLPIYCKPQIAFGKEGGNVNVILGQKTVENEDVTDVIVILPFPKFVTSTSLNANVGNIIYDDINRICRWSLTKLPKDKTPVLSGKVSVDSTFQTNCTMTAQLQFEIIGSTVSGLKVTSINMFGENYKPFKGVRRITRAGNFQIRCN